MLSESRDMEEIPLTVLVWHSLQVVWHPNLESCVDK